MKHELSRLGYIFDDSRNIWHKPGYGGINYSDGDEVEKRIGDAIKSTNDISTLSTELRQHCIDWPSVYHLSNRRSNIFRPFAHALRGDVLEIGAGCGAITRFLGESGANVLALEGTPRRAAIARSRTRDLPNVEVLADKFDEFATDSKFDVVTLIGVLEYANLFTNAESPALSMLRKAQSLLKPTGKLVIAIENQFGLKYFAGASEDHVNVPMYGIENRYRADQPQTFGQVALTELLREAGFSKTEFLAPFPDYKMPVSIVTELGAVEPGFDAAALAGQSTRGDPQLPEHLAFAPELAWPGLFKNQLGMHLSNSFVIIAGTDAQTVVDPQTLAWHFSTERKPEFCKSTQFIKNGDGSIKVQYRALRVPQSTPKAGQLLVHATAEQANYWAGQPLNNALNLILSTDAWQFADIAEFLQTYFQALAILLRQDGQPFRSTDFTAELPGSYFDVLPQNIIVDQNNQFHIIDREWHLQSNVQLGYLVFRTIWNAFHTTTRIAVGATQYGNTLAGLIKATFSALGWQIDDRTLYSYLDCEAACQSEVSGTPLDLNEFQSKAFAVHEQKLNYSGIYHSVSVAKQRAVEIERQQAETQRIKEEMQRQIQERDARFLAITSSRSWKITLPMREAHRWISSPQAQFVRYTDMLRLVKNKLAVHAKAGRLVEKIYRRIPMATYHKASFKGKIFRHFGFLFSRTNAYKRWIDHVGATNIGHSVDETPQPRAWSQVYDDAPLSFDLSDNPLVSIIIPVYNNWHFTDTCLRSVKLRTPDSIPHEIIVANDCSTDDTKANCEAIPGLRLVTNPHNLGFLRNCNHAVRHARGKYVVLLNNDTEVGPNWLQAMLNVFQNFDRVGVVAGKLIYPNGVVQEAGGIMMKNGWGHPFGRFGNPDHFEFNYVKDVDCAIGACLMIDRDIFDELGGLDERYAPAHYEEFDFEFAVKAAGYRVMYQPATEIIHHESVSGGTDFRTRQSHINHEKFCEKWAAQLASRPETESDQYLARDLSANRKRILLVDDKVPHHDQHAGAVTIFQYVRLLTKLGFQVVYLPHDLQLVQPYTNDLQQLGVEVIYGRFNFAEWFTEHGATFDYCWLCRPDIANQYIDTIRKYGKAKIIYYTHDLHFLREQRSYELTGNRADLLESHRLRTLESKIFNTVDIVLTPSHEEQKTIIEMCPKANAHAITAYMYETMSVDSRSQATEFARRKDLVFLGGYGHAPNVDAVVWFVTDVLPLVLRKIPDIVFHIAGSNVPPQVQALEGPHVNVQGFVPDLEPYFSTFRVFVAPLRYGAGVKGKIVSSLVHGVPVVTTSIGNEGIDLVNGEQALVADGAEEFANLVCQLYNDQATWCKLSAAGIDYINQNFSVDAARITIQAILAPSATTTPTTRTN